MTLSGTYDVAITGGGLAGLSLSMLLAEKGHKVLLLEKEQYPFHKVCGEYISMESWDHLERLGAGLKEMDLPMIRHLEISGVNGTSIQQALPLGGFGISRYVLDATLARLAKQRGVTIIENAKTNDIEFLNDQSIIHSTAGVFECRVACGSFGKRSNLDVKWHRNFARAAQNKLNNYVGVKYHVCADFPKDRIALHLFRNGYCGIVQVENNISNLCYLTTAANIQQSGSIERMEKELLSQNPHLKKFLAESEKCWQEPITISQISFDRKNQVENHVLLAGDAAGMITPLCGNGMSMALHGSKIAADQIDLFLKGLCDRNTMEKKYAEEWNRQFSKRLRMGRRIQRLFGNPALTNLFIYGGRLFPSMLQWMIRQTHGKPF